MEQYKQGFIEFMVESKALKFGDFTLKSGRKSPFFMNAGAYVTGSQLMKLGEYYARAIHDTYGDDFDVLFGPAYKGIPISVVTAIAYSTLYGKEIRYCSDRKEEKDHGADKGSFLGSKLKDGDRVIMIEDVTTSGKSMEETVPKVRGAADVEIRGLMVSLNRMEVGLGGKVSALDEIKEKYGFEDSDVLASEEFGPTVGKDLRANATKSILLAALCMLIYIRFRFKNWQYGLAAVAGLAHDVLVALSLYAIFRITINNPFIAGILTVVGYSINDTIVVFDRIRENSKFFKRKQAAQLIDTSINQTLSRSLMTSLTTLLVMIPLFIMASSELRSFLIPLMIGVFTGTYSSIFLCSPVFYELTKKEGISKYEDNKAKADKQRKKSAKRRDDEGIRL